MCTVWRPRRSARFSRGPDQKQQVYKSLRALQKCFLPMAERSSLRDHHAVSQWERNRSPHVPSNMRANTSNMMAPAFVSTAIIANLLSPEPPLHRTTSDVYGIRKVGGTVLLGSSAPAAVHLHKKRTKILITLCASSALPSLMYLRYGHKLRGRVLGRCLRAARFFCAQVAPCRLRTPTDQIRLLSRTEIRCGNLELRKHRSKWGPHGST